MNNHYQHSQNLEQFVKELPAFPLHLDLEINSQCNYGCSYCPQSETPNKQGFTQGKMDIETAKKIIQYFADNGTKTIKLFWRGEPSINKDTPALLAYAKECGLFTMLNTNGSFPFKNQSDYYQNLDWISFSIDNHHVPRGQDVPNAHDPAIGLTILDFKVKSNAIVQVQSGTPSNEWREFCDRWGIEYIADEITKRTDADYDHVDLTKRHRKNCGFPLWRMIVKYDLRVGPCCVAWKDGDLEMGQILIGDLDSVKRIWNSQTYFELREDQATLVYRNEVCKNCVSGSAYV